MLHSPRFSSRFACERLFRCGCYHASLQLGGQNLAATCTTTGQNLTAVGSCHSLTETVNLGTVTTAGLIGTLHVEYTSCFNYLCSTVRRPQQHIVVDYHNPYLLSITQKCGLVNPFFRDFQKIFDWNQCDRKHICKGRCQVYQDMRKGRILRSSLRNDY